MDEKYLGAIDTQTLEQKSLNYNFNELVTAPAPVNWEERDFKKLYPIRNQDGSSTCVAQTYATELGIIAKQKYGAFLDFSATYPYQYRKYPENEGCSSEDIYSIFPKKGNIFESFMPSQNISESQVMSIKRKSYFDDLAKVYLTKRIQLPLDFETIASTIQTTGKGVMLWFRFSYSEWQNIPVVLDKPANLGHSVTGVDFILKGGKKYLVIQDSWGLQSAIGGYRLISEEYFKARCFLASYLMTFQIQSGYAARPIFDGSISSAKDCLKFEGVFPLNVDSNEVADNIFRTAVKGFQKRYNIFPTLGNFGPITKAKLKEVYN